MRAHAVLFRCESCQDETLAAWYAWTMPLPSHLQTCLRCERGIRVATASWYVTRDEYRVLADVRGRFSAGERSKRLKAEIQLLPMLAIVLVPFGLAPIALCETDSSFLEVDLTARERTRFLVEAGFGAECP